jgi:predicted nucleic acid-binding protein
MRVALDTHVLAYAEGVGDATRRDISLALLANLDPASVLLPAQALGELFRVLTGKARRSGALARAAVLGWADSFDIGDSTWTGFQAAFDLAADHGLSMWNSLILSVAAEGRCRVLLSEDFQAGFTWRGVTVVNPYADESSPLLKAALMGAGATPRKARRRTDL